MTDAHYRIKCVVWDLDNTLWDGTLLEGDVKLRPGISGIIRELDRRGILHSIASRNDPDAAIAMLKHHGLDSFFLEPRINWLPKSTNIAEISNALDIPLDAIAFVDDDPFELEQVLFMLPGVMTIAAAEVPGFCGMDVFSPEWVTEEAVQRRQFYQAEQERITCENRYRDRKAFLKSCDMQMRVKDMESRDIPRVLELMSRTHQLNAASRKYDEQDLVAILRQPGLSTHIKVAKLTDRFGAYGTIGAAVAEKREAVWRLMYFAMSCRVLGRGVEQAFLVFLLEHAKAQGCRAAEAIFRDNSRNRILRARYQMAGFTVRDTSYGRLLFCNDLKTIPGIPEWVSIS